MSNFQELEQEIFNSIKEKQGEEVFNLDRYTIPTRLVAVLPGNIGLLYRRSAQHPVQEQTLIRLFHEANHTTRVYLRGEDLVSNPFLFERWYREIKGQYQDNHYPEEVSLSLSVPVLNGREWGDGLGDPSLTLKIKNEDGLSSRLSLMRVRLADYQETNSNETPSLWTYSGPIAPTIEDLQAYKFILSKMEAIKE